MRTGVSRCPPPHPRRYEIRSTALTRLVGEVGYKVPWLGIRISHYQEGPVLLGPHADGGSKLSRWRL